MITKETVKKVVDDMKALDYRLPEIEAIFKVALKEKIIDVDTYFNAMQQIYGEE